MGWFMKLINNQKYKSRRKTLVEALRSGDFTQISGGLHESGGYCCLGVACELTNLDDWETEDEDSELTYYRYLGDSGYLPLKVRDFYGWSHCHGLLTFYDRHGIQNTLATLNDAGFSFSEIADIIHDGLVEEAD